jgi:hypothetical protein
MDNDLAVIGAEVPRQFLEVDLEQPAIDSSPSPSHELGPFQVPENVSDVVALPPLPPPAASRSEACSFRHPSYSSPCLRPLTPRLHSRTGFPSGVQTRGAMILLHHRVLWNLKRDVGENPNAMARDAGKTRSVVPTHRCFDCLLRYRRLHRTASSSLRHRDPHRAWTLYYLLVVISTPGRTCQPRQLELHLLVLAATKYCVRPHLERGTSRTACWALAHEMKICQ